MKAVRLLALLALTSSIGTKVFAQSFGNEWIDFNQSYFEIKILEEGIYRVNQSSLLSAGVPLSSIDPRRMQIFYRGVEQSILIEGENDGSFDNGDYIEFYGRPNDGANENELYIEPNAQPHDQYSLFSDSSSYFLTWRLSPQNGKRISSFFENNVSAIPAENYHLEKELILNVNNYSVGQTYSGGNVILSQYDFGEGWTGSAVSKGNTGTVTFENLELPITSGPNPTLRVILAGRNNLSHNVNLSVGPNSASLRQIGNAQFSGQTNFTFESEILWTDIGASGEFIIQFSVLGFGDDADRVSVSLAELDFAQATDMGNANSKIFRTRPEPTNRSYLEVSNSPGNVTLYDITDPDNIIAIGINQTATNFNVVVPLTVSTRELFAYSNPLTSFVISPTTFQEIDPTDHNYIIITHNTLRQATIDGLPDPVGSYESYRESAEGGAHNVFIADIETLYDQYNFGEPSPLAIRRFADYLLSNGSPQFMFLIGEGLDVNNSPERRTEANLAANNLVHLIPTFGTPGSDEAILAGLQGSDFVSPLPIGRITARTPDDVQAYLNKVIEYDAEEINSLRRKRLLHLSGGTTPQELVIFRSNVDGFKDIAVNDFLGGSVSTVSKQSSSPIELFNVSEAVNAGLGLITFFGHSGANGSDLDIGEVSNPSFGYDNQGIYTSIVVNGCNAGDIFGTGDTFGEDWILTPDRGAVTYMAHSDNGISTTLQRYTRILYEVAYGDSSFVSRSIGEVRVETGQRMIDQFGTSQLNIAQIQQFVLQGDPAVTLFGADQPDYALNDTDISINSFDGQLVNSLTDSFEVNVIVRNFGRTSNSNFNVTLNRFLSDGSTQTFGPESFDAVSFEDTLSFAVRNIGAQSGFGNNRFEVIIDPDDAVEELSELNNTASLDFFLSSGTSVNLFPKNFGIETEGSVRFLAQTSDLLSENRGFIFELDTNKFFNSPIKITRTGNFKVLAEWNVDLPITNVDTLVYYWRTKFSEIRDNEIDQFAESSFTYIPGSSNGWAQSSFDQFDLLEAIGVFKDEVTNNWAFVETSVEALVMTHGVNHFPDDAVIYDSLAFTLQNENILRTGNSAFICRSNSINAVAFDEASLANYVIFGVNAGRSGVTCGRSPFIINNILDSEISGTGLKLNSYLDQVFDNDFVLLWSIGQLNYSSWPTDVFDALRNYGVSSGFLAGLQDGGPVIIIGQKGAAEGTAIEISGSDTDVISLLNELNGNFTSGSLETLRIGPAKEWQSFFQNTSISESPQTDNFSFDLIGVDTEGTEIVLFDDINDVNLDLSSISADQFPFIKLRFNTEDETNLTTAQLNRWQVNFEGVPEGILLTNDPLVTRDSTIQRDEGAPFETNYFFKNISALSFEDSISVRLSLFNNQLRENFQETLRIAPLAPDDSATFSYPVSTFDKVGSNDINVFVNPEETTEVSINNNIIDISDFLEVEADDTNPILDVTFDGAYILDGDIVSPSPNILVRLKDNNPFILKGDTVGMEISLRQPCTSGCDFERVNFSSPDISVTPATDETDFQIEYNPQQLVDGIYGIRVQATDASGNQSGTQPYEINFEVINESTITHFYPYPNPFSTSTRFVFTLTGSEIPDQIKIQIMTVSGRIVREITQDELGPIRIGNNLTDFAWDGRDEFGDQLANGVYLYRVILRSNGERIERRNTSADKAFKNGFGKIYLLR